MSLAPLNVGHVVRGNALTLPVRPGSVSLIVSSPPYWALRAYEDAGEFFDGQLGSESDPVQFLRNLWRSMDEGWDALRDDGVAWINLGDKYAGSGGHNNSGIAPSEKQRRSQAEAMRRTRAGERDTRDAFRSAHAATARDRARESIDAPVAARASRTKSSTATRRQAPDRYEQGTGWARAKSLMGLPWAFVMGLTNPTLFRDHLDPPVIPCTAEGCEAGYVERLATPEEVDAGHELGVAFDPCPECDGTGTVEGPPHPQWVWRAEHIWSKPNGLPESVSDRPRRTHEVWFMLAKNGDHYGSTDPIREPYNPNAHPAAAGGAMYRPGPMAETWGIAGSQSIDNEGRGRTAPDSRGKPPGSVWSIAGEPFVDDLFHLLDDGMRVVTAEELAILNRGRGPAPDPGELGGLLADAGTMPKRPPLLEVAEAEHFAPFPTEWPRRLILGWSPSGICTACDEGRFPVVSKQLHQIRDAYDAHRPGRHLPHDDGMRDNGYTGKGKVVAITEANLLGYACSCTPRTDHGPAGQGFADPDRKRAGAVADGKRHDMEERRPRYEYHFDQWTPAPTRKAVVLDMFGGTGTVALVASVLDRVGVSIDLSWTYCRLAEWRTRNQKHRDKVRRRTNAEGQEAIDLSVFPEPMATEALARDVVHATPAHARSTDPDTSRRAALNVMPRTGAHRHRVLAMLAVAGDAGLTADQLCLKLGDRNGSSWRSRLAECADPERYDPPLAELTGEERTTRQGEAARVFRITEAGAKVLASIEGTG